MASSGSFNTSAYGSGDYNRYLTFSWSVQSQSVANNTTTIAWTLKGAGGSTSSWVQSGNFQVVIDGATVYSSSTRINLYNGTTVASGTYTMSHDSVGNKSFSASAQAGIYYVAVNCTGSGSWSLPQIPRYATSNQSLTSKTETSITMKWSSDSTVDYIWYSTNGGSSWTGINVTDGKSGSYTISGLTANTTYSIKTRVRRKDSQLTTDSSALSVTTYNYPYASAMPDFTLGNQLTITVYNPLGRTFTITAIGDDDSELTASSSYSGTSVSGFNGTSYLNFWYASIPNATSGTYSIRIDCSATGSSMTKTGGTYTVNTSACAPSITSVAYADTNSTTIAITGNNQNIIQNNSIVGYTATGLTTQYSASISSVSVEVNGSTYALTVSGTSATGTGSTINSSSDVTATFTITDSRGLTATKTATISMLEWSLPSAIISMNRQSNYYATTYLTVDADYSSLDSNNTITIVYRIKKTSDSSYGSDVTISDNVQTTFTADKDYAWDVQVVLTDRIGSTTYNLTLERGMPLIYFDRLLNSIGINCFPVDTESVEVNGFNIIRSVATATLSANITSLTTSDYTLIPLDQSNVTGSKLTVNASGEIVIGSGVSKVLVSGVISYAGITVAGSRHARIVKNSYSAANTLGWTWDSLAVSDAESLVIPPQLVDVDPGDEIGLYYWTQQSSDTIGGNTVGGRTSLTVEVVA